MAARSGGKVLLLVAALCCILGIELQLAFAGHKAPYHVAHRIARRCDPKELQSRDSEGDEETVIPVVDDDAEEEEIVMEEDMGAVPAEGFGFKAFDPESERRPDPLAVEVVDTKTTIVDTAEKARAVLDILTGPTCRDLYHAVDTEVMGWRPGISPYLKGEIFCISIYCGEEIDFGEGGRLFIDDLYLDSQGRPQRRGILELFKNYLEDPSIKKVFHNYAFDRAQFVREGIRVQGFYADTMHMAYLDDSKHESFTLQYLGKHLLGEDWAKNSLTALAEEADYDASQPEKLHLHKDPKIRKSWEDYSAFDTQATWKLFERLQMRLQRYKIDLETGKTLFDLYTEVHAPYADVLVNMEEAGFPIDEDVRAEEAKVVAGDLIQAERDFMDWVKKQYEARDDPDLLAGLQQLNFKSVKQVRHIINGWGLKVIAGHKLFGLRLASGFFIQKAISEKISLRGLVDRLQQVETNPDGTDSLIHCRDQDAGPALFNLGRVLAAGTQDCASAALDEVSTWNKRVWPNMFLASTGVVKRSKPNPTNLLKHKWLYPRLFQKVVAPSRGQALITVSYEDLQLALLAHMAGDERLLYGFEEGFDLHSMVAWELCPQVMEDEEKGYVSVYPKAHNNDNSVENLYPREYRMARRINNHFTRYHATKSWMEDLQEYDSKYRDAWFKYHKPITDWWKYQVRQSFDKKKVVGRPAAATLRGRLMTVPDAYDWKISNEMKARRSDQVVSAVQTGSYYDVIKEATLKLGRCPELARLGYRVIMQHYDDFLLEGPDANAEKAMEVAKQHLQDPFYDGLQLRVPLRVKGDINRAKAT